MPAGMGHQSGARGGTSTGWADRAHHMRCRFQRHGGAGSGIRVTKGYTTLRETHTHLHLLSREIRCIKPRAVTSPSPLLPGSF